MSSFTFLVRRKSFKGLTIRGQTKIYNGGKGLIYTHLFCTVKMAAVKDTLVIQEVTKECSINYKNTVLLKKCGQWQLFKKCKKKKKFVFSFVVVWLSFFFFANA